MGKETTEMYAENAVMQKNIDMVMAAFNYNRAEPCIVRETDHWAVVYKPPHLPTAPLRADERNTLVYWFLHSDKTREHTRSDARQIDAQEHSAEYGLRSREAQVRGKKAIEAGLLHRLDTDTRGLVLFAKDQAVYDFLAARQEAGQIIKTYCAFIEPNGTPEIDDGYGFDAIELSTLKELSAVQRGIAAQEQVVVQERIAAKLPLTLESQFRNFGPGAKRVAPVFSDSRHYKKDGRLYTTVIEAADILPFSIGGNDAVPQTAYEFRPSSPLIRVRCRLSRGYRHQVRAHLAAAGLPIAGDPLYGPQGAEAQPEAAAVSLQLYAVSLEFPDPENPRQNIRVALPPPDKMNP